MERLRPTAGVRLGRAIQATMVSVVAPCAVATLPFGTSMGLSIGAPVAAVGLAIVSTRAARVAVELDDDCLVVRNVYWTYRIPKSRVRKFTSTTVASNYQVLGVDYNSMGAYARRKGGLPLDGTMSFQAEVKNDSRRVLSSWLTHRGVAAVHDH